MLAREHLELLLWAAGGLLTLAALLARVIVPALRSLRTVGRQFVTFLDIFTGRPAYVDELRGVTVPAVPPLLDRLTGIEQSQIEISHALALQTDVIRSQADHAEQLAALSARVDRLAAAIEQQNRQNPTGQEETR